ncbi:MAG: DUF3341 domain-containing protein [FCB group bacterium]|nr:DUF3341 domain-containing protein [FCB group bacterium]
MTKQTLYGFLAEFSTPGDLLQAAEKVRDAGYQKFDCHTPFPVHGLDDAMGMPRTKLGYVIGLFALLGAIGGFWLQAWTSTVGYPMVIAGKPYFSWQAFIIVTFGLMVLAGAFSALFGMFHFNRLPRLHHPLFNSENFKRATDDGFFISIEAQDTRFNPAETRTFLTKIGAKNVEAISSE